MNIIYIVLFCFINFVYIKTWNKLSDKVPTGIGIILIIPFFIFFLNQNLNLIHSLLLIIFSLIYFFDDLKGLHFLSRILLQIAASLVIYFSLSLEFNYILIFLNLSFFLLIINFLNFQDGEDLNISTLLIIIFFVFHFYSENKLIQNTSEIILYFLISFSFFNVKKNFLYFGDSGCYFVSIIIFLFFYSELQNYLLIKLIFSTILFPLTDVVYVILYRIFNKENLLTRNYLHIYQILSIKTKSKIYLLINAFFPTLNIIIALNFSLSLNLIISLIILNITLLLMMRILIKKLITNK